jgi:uncharacterized protein YggE
MKKTLLTAAVLGLIAVSAPLSTQAVTQVSHDRGYISVSTSANTEVAPDVAEISFAVQTSDSKSMQKATQLNKEASDRVLSVLSSMLNSSNGDYIKTSKVLTPSNVVPRFLARSPALDWAFLVAIPRRSLH